MDSATMPTERATSLATGRSPAEGWEAPFVTMVRTGVPCVTTSSPPSAEQQAVRGALIAVINPDLLWAAVTMQPNDPGLGDDISPLAERMIDVLADLERTTERQRTVAGYRWGGEGMGQRATGRAMGISVQRVAEIETALIARLRDWLRAERLVPRLFRTIAPVDFANNTRALRAIYGRDFLGHLFGYGGKTINAWAKGEQPTRSALDPGQFGVVWVVTMTLRQRMGTRSLKAWWQTTNDDMPAEATPAEALIAHFYTNVLAAARLVWESERRAVVAAVFASGTDGYTWLVDNWRRGG